MRDLTSLFGKGRGEHPRQNHHKIFNNRRLSEAEANDYNKLTYWEVVRTFIIKKIKAYGQLVLLGFAVTNFTPVAYQRGSLPRPLKVNSS